MMDTLDRWLAAVIITLGLFAAALRHAHRVSARRRLRRRYGAY